MLRNSSLSPGFARILLASCLCLLAFAFAIEAKTAWYQPAQGPAMDISAAKAMPADSPVSHAIRAQLAHSIPPQSAILWLVVFSAVLIFAAGARQTEILARRPKAVRCQPHFSALLFYRPPPAVF